MTLHQSAGEPHRFVCPAQQEFQVDPRALMSAGACNTGMLKLAKILTAAINKNECRQEGFALHGRLPS